MKVLSLVFIKREAKNLSISICRCWDPDPDPGPIHNFCFCNRSVVVSFKIMYCA